MPRTKKAEEPAVETKEAAVKAKKPAAKKVEPKTTVTIQYGDKEVTVKDLLAAAQKAYKKGHRGVVIKKVDVYVKPEENAAYYVVNGEASEDFKIEL